MIVFSVLLAVAIPAQAVRPVYGAEAMVDGLVDYAKRDGAADAQDMARNDVVRIYHYMAYTRGPMRRTPGLKNCRPRLANESEPAIFLSLPEAEFSESVRYSPERYASIEAAQIYARSFNHEMFRLKADTILKICPQAELDASL